MCDNCPISDLLKKVDVKINISFDKSRIAIVKHVEALHDGEMDSLIWVHDELTKIIKQG